MCVWFLWNIEQVRLSENEQFQDATKFKHGQLQDATKVNSRSLF